MVRGIDYMRRLLGGKRPRIDARYSYYEMKNAPQDLALVRNGNIAHIHPKIGWCAKAVDSLADRLSFKGWKDDNFTISQIFDLNNADILFDSAILNALITSCSFIWIKQDSTGFPHLEVISGRDATGVIDPVTNMLEEGYAVLKRDDLGSPTLEAHFLPGTTVFYEVGQRPYEVENSAPYPLLVPVIYRPDAKRPLGHSRISRAMMSLTDNAIRTLKRSEISAEFYSFPQKYILGTNPDDDPMEKWSATISTFMEITKDQDGDKPTVGQFQQQSMSPYTEQIKTLAALFAGESGLTMDDLGFVSENPSSAEAIKASHESLRVLATKAQRTFGVCFLNVGYLAACVRDNVTYSRQQFYLTKAQWFPAFPPDASALSIIGDGAIKINQAIPGYFNTDNLEVLTGVEPSEKPVPEPEEPSDE